MTIFSGMGRIKSRTKFRQSYEDFSDESEIARDFRLVKLPKGSTSRLLRCQKKML